LLVLSKLAPDCDQQHSRLGIESGQSMSLIAVGLATGVLITNNTLRHRRDCASGWSGVGRRGGTLVGVRVEGAGGTAADHARQSRCTSCLIDGAVVVPSPRAA
jgi:hypothetical protein